MPRTFESLSAQVIGAAIEVHRALGPGFLEVTYSRALGVALERAGLPFVREHEVALTFAGAPVGTYRLDLVVGAQIVVELKAIRRLEDLHFAQLRAYLKASGLHVGLLMNFNASTLAIRRVVSGLQE